MVTLVERDNVLIKIFTINMDKMAGTDFDTSLIELKSLAENLSSPKG
jgi:hypothetical protein